MSKELSLLTEWAWSMGYCESDPRSAEMIASVFQRLLVLRYRGAVGRKSEGLEFIVKDVQRTLKILRYGGRQPQDINPQRKDYLQKNIWLAQLFG